MQNLIIFQSFELTIPVGTMGIDYFVSPTNSYNNDEMNDYIRPKQLHNPDGQLHLSYFRPGIVDMRLKKNQKRRNIKIYTKVNKILKVKLII